MGQYYIPIVLNKKNHPAKWWEAFEFNGNGLKLMEHSYINNSLCNAVERYLIHNPQKLVWAGDYADNETGLDKNLYRLCSQPRYVTRKSSDNSKAAMSTLPGGMYVVNHTKEIYYARDEVLSIDMDGYDFSINPLPILTCEGNGRGGGDYEGTEMDCVGTWARDVIEITETVPEGYTEEFYEFMER